MEKNTIVLAVAVLLAGFYVMYQYLPSDSLPTGAAVFVDTLRRGAENPMPFNPGMPEYRLVVLTDSSSASCETGEIVGYLKEIFSGVEVAYVELDSATGERLIEKYSLSTVPAYVLNLEVESNPGFPLVSNAFLRSADGYVIKLDDEYVCRRI